MSLSALRRRIQPKAQIWLSAVSYILITIVVIVLLLNTGLPLLEKVKDKSIYSRTKDAFLKLNEQIKDVQAEGPGSQRVIPIEILKGEFSVSDNQVKWSMDTKAKIVEPRTKIFVGDLIIGDDSFITFQDTRKYVDEGFNDMTNLGSTGTCSTFSTSGSLVFTDSACATTESVFSHTNATRADALTLEFNYHGGASTTIPTDEIYVGFMDRTASSPTGPAGQVAGFVFNGTSGMIQTAEYDSGTLYIYNCSTYASGTTYYGKVSLNYSEPHYFISTDEKTWTACRNRNSTKPTSMAAAAIAVSGSGTVDDLVIHDNMLHINNSYLAVQMNKHPGSKESPQPINTSRLISDMYSLLTNTSVVGNFTFRINDVATSETGLGYVEVSELRTDPDAAVIISHVNATNYEYDLVFTIEGGVDFLQVNVQNLVIR